MHLAEISSRFTRVLPWRVNQWIENVQLRAMRFSPGLRELHVRGSDPAGTLIAVGDVAFCGSIGQNLEANEITELPQETISLLAGADLSVGNLETMLTGQRLCSNSIGSFLNAPVSAASLLESGGFDVLNVANNHTRDCGRPGLQECLQLLGDLGIRTCGAGAACERPPAVAEAAGVRVGFLGYCDNFRLTADPHENAVPAVVHDESIESDLATLRQQVDLVILQLHWGWEFAMHPLLNYRDRARRFADAGADVVICHHAHVPMGVEVWNTSVIAHGLGNFIFPPDEYLTSGHPWSNRTIAIKVFFDKAGAIGAEIIPCVIDEIGFPRLAEGRVAAEILGGIGRASRRLQDTSWLKWLERDRTVRDTTSFFSALQHCDPGEIQEWALQLHSPFRKDVVARLEHGYGPAAQKLAAFMREFAASYQDPILMNPLWKKSRENDLISALQSFRSSNVVGANLPGRVP